ncbi:MAG: hypothetical protein AAB281_00295, partial [Actinomycetota bacterium]
ERLKGEADAVTDDGRDWRAEEVAAKLNQIAGFIERIGRQHQTGIDASLGKRSGRKFNTL